MDIKVKYQYSYFIYPFLIEKNEYSKYIRSLLQNERISVDIFEKSKDLELYTHFLPEISKKMFSTFYLSKMENILLIDNNINSKEKVMKKMGSIQFDYNLDDYIAENKKEDTIFFGVDKLKILCFNSGLCFLIIKTHIDNLNDFSDVLNFNYKFSNILNSEYKKINNISIESNQFNSIQELLKLINLLSNNKKCLLKELFTYSYVCLDSNVWTNKNDFDNLLNVFLKFKNVLPSNYSSEFSDSEKSLENTYSKWKHSIYGFSKKSGVVFSSGIDTFNFTKLPYYFENVYFYTMIIALYKSLSDERIYRITTSDHVSNLWECWGKALSFKNFNKKCVNTNNTFALDAIIALSLVSIILDVCILVEKEANVYPLLNIIACLSMIGIIIAEKNKKNK